MSSHLTFSLLGNPNCGKTAVFNLLTGLNQKVSNYPGITVERKIAQISIDNNTKITIEDYPGAYSFIPQSIDEEIVTIEVQLDTLDNQIGDHDRVDLIKIDVEGAEFGVLKGAVNVIDKFHPVIVFEHGIGASDHYDTSPEDVFNFFESINYQIFTLKDFIENIGPLEVAEFVDCYKTNREYYFLAKLKVL